MRLSGASSLMSMAATLRIFPDRATKRATPAAFLVAMNAAFPAVSAT